MIKNLVISGGGYRVFNIFGIIYQLQKKNIYNIQNIKCIYGVSAGSIIGAMLCLKMDLNDILNYVINRPWEKDIILDPDNIFNIINKNGMFSNNFINIIFEKLLLSNNLNSNINLLEFYNYSKIDLHIFSLSCNDMQLINFSYKTYPKLKLINAIHMSCTIPFIFQPIYFNNSYMIDGAILNHFPYELCQKNNKDEEILGILIKKKYINIKEDSNIFNLYSAFFCNLIYYHNSKSYDNYENNKNIIIYSAEKFDKSLLIKLINNKETRKEEIEKGYKLVNEYLLNLK